MIQYQHLAISLGRRARKVGTVIRNLDYTIYKVAREEISRNIKVGSFEGAAWTPRTRAYKHPPLLKSKAMYRGLIKRSNYRKELRGDGITVRLMGVSYGRIHNEGLLNEQGVPGTATCIHKE